jgi:predicted HAD superfamily Cof-like phosphohydrolase
MDDYLNRLQRMHQHFGIDRSEVDTFSPEEKAFRVSAMLEEIGEFLTATSHHDQLDALVDLIVFAFGTVERAGYAEVFGEAFTRVMDSNMTKFVGPNQKRGSFALDLRKPDDFKPADLTDLVEDM